LQCNALPNFYPLPALSTAAAKLDEKLHAHDVPDIETAQHTCTLHSKGVDERAAADMETGTKVQDNKRCVHIRDAPRWFGVARLVSSLLQLYACSAAGRRVAAALQLPAATVAARQISNRGASKRALRGVGSREL